MLSRQRRRRSYRVHCNQCSSTKCVDLCKGFKSSLTERPIYVVAAGGIYDGRGLAMALSYGAQAVWVGTRFVMSKESGSIHPLINKIFKLNHLYIIQTLLPINF